MLDWSRGVVERLLPRRGRETNVMCCWDIELPGGEHVLRVHKAEQGLRGWRRAGNAMGTLPFMLWLEAQDPFAHSVCHLLLPSQISPLVLAEAGHSRFGRYEAYELNVFCGDLW